MHVLITGGCGFIGSHLADYHLAKGDQVTVVDDLSTGSLKNIALAQMNPHFQLEQGDILSWPHLESAVARADRIYHLAAVVGVRRVLAEPLAVISNNIGGCERLLQAVANTRPHCRVILVSSSAVYADSQKPLLNEEDPLIVNLIGNPLRNYSLSKIMDEALGLTYYQKAHIPLTLVRLFNTIGPRQKGSYGMVVPRFIQQACQNEPLIVYGDGTQTRSFCDVRDVVSILDILAETKESEGQIINVGYDRELSINELARLICTRSKSRSKIEYISYREAYGQEYNDIKQRRPDLKKLRKLTGYIHKWTLEQTIDDLLQSEMSNEV